MSLSVRLNGVDYVNFLGGTVTMSMETAAMGFAFSATADEDNEFPIINGDLVQILADGIVVCTGYVEKYNESGSSNTHVITVAGRSLLADFIDSSVGKVTGFEGQVNLEDIIRATLNELPLPDIKIINNAGSIKNFDAADIASAEVGQTAFAFVEPYARKRQVLITTDGDGNVVLARAGTITGAANIKHMRGSDDNNVLAWDYNDDHSGLFNTYTANSQLNPVNLKAGSNAKQISDQVSSRFNTHIRDSRTKEFTAEKASDEFTLRDRAGWEANIAWARSKTYKCTVQGHTVDGVPWTPNRLHRVDDDIVRGGVHAEMLLKSVKFDYSEDTGSTTSLEFINKLAYTLEVEQTARELTTDVVGSTP